MKRALGILFICTLLAASAACGAPSSGKSSDNTQSSLASSASGASSETSGGIEFNDAILEKRVREQLKKPEGAVTAADAEATEVLNLKNEENKSEGTIKDISALKYFKNLKVLDISLNDITDISCVAEMKNLEAFYSMNGNSNLKDFSPLSGLTKMLDLSILGNANISDANVGFVAGMTSIEMLWLSDAPNLTDISAVAAFTNLVRLNLNKTGVSDLSPVAALVKMDTMDLSGSKVSDVSPLKSLVNLKCLRLADCPITDYSPLKDIYPKLEEKDFTLE